MIKIFAITAVLLLMPIASVGQNSATQSRAWTVTTQFDEMTSKNVGTFHSAAISEAKADLRMRCTDGVWTNTEIVLDRPVGSRYVMGGLAIVAEIRLNDGTPYYDNLFVRDDMRTINWTSSAHSERQLVSSKKIAIQYQTVGGVSTVVVFEPPAFDPDIVKKYCGLNPQEQAPLQLVIENISGKRANDMSDWVEYQIDDGQVKQTYAFDLPLTVEAESKIKISVGNNATMKQLGFNMNGHAVKAAWQAIGDKRSPEKFTVTIQQP